MHSVNVPCTRFLLTIVTCLNIEKTSGRSIRIALLRCLPCWIARRRTSAELLAGREGSVRISFREDGPTRVCHTSLGSSEQPLGLDGSVAYSHSKPRGNCIQPSRLCNFFGRNRRSRENSARSSPAWRRAHVLILYCCW